MREEEWKKVQEKEELPDKDRYFVKEDIAQKMLLDKQHKILRNKHPDILLVTRNKELEILTNAEI